MTVVRTPSFARANRLRAPRNRVGRFGRRHGHGGPTRVDDEDPKRRDRGNLTAAAANAVYGVAAVGRGCRERRTRAWAVRGERETVEEWSRKVPRRFRSDALAVVRKTERQRPYRLSAVPEIRCFIRLLY